MNEYTYGMIKEVESLEDDVKKSMDNSINFQTQITILLTGIYKLASIYLKARLHRIF